MAGLIHVVILLCALSAPTLCREEPVGFADGALPMQCLQSGEIAAVDYVSAHPQWALRAIRCER